MTFPRRRVWRKVPETAAGVSVQLRIIHLTH